MRSLKHRSICRDNQGLTLSMGEHSLKRRYRRACMRAATTVRGSCSSTWTFARLEICCSCSLLDRNFWCLIGVPLPSQQHVSLDP